MVLTSNVCILKNMIAVTRLSEFKIKKTFFKKFRGYINQNLEGMTPIFMYLCMPFVLWFHSSAFAEANSNRILAASQIDPPKVNILFETKISALRKNSHVELIQQSSDAVDKFFNVYDRDKNQVISKREFVESTATEQTKDFVGRVYDNVLDLNKNGSVTLEEYLKFSKKTPASRVFGAYDTEGPEVKADSKWNVSEFSQAYDLDGDGVVTKEQFSVARMVILGGYDYNEDGVVDIPSGLEPVDKDRDGLVSQTEYEAFQVSPQIKPDSPHR